MDDIDAIFCHLLGEMDDLTHSLMPAVDAPDAPDADADADADAAASLSGSTLAIGFTDLRESLNELEEQDLDALVTDLGSEPPQTENSGGSDADKQIATPAATQECEPAAVLPPPSSTDEKPQQTCKPQTKEDKIQFALENLTDAKLIVKVLMSDGSSKTLMVDERQTVGEVLDRLFEKTYCDGSVDWSLCETHPKLQTERVFEDHECLVEQLSTWARQSENKIYFLSRPEKYMMFKEPQVFYMWKKKKDYLKEINKQAKQLLIKESFEGPALIVPDLEAMLHLKEDGKKVWRSRYFTLRASGIYFVPKGKTKSSSDLTCLVRFEKINVYTTSNYRQKFRAPTDFCFVLKHPCIQKDSHYIKFLCCDDEHTMLLWVNSIRIAKYGTVLYKNYQAAVKRAPSLPAVYLAAQNDGGSGHVEDCPHEPPPDFIPPPPPTKHTQV